MRSQTNKAAGSTIDCFLDQPRLVLGTSALEGRLFRSFFFFLVAAPTASTPTILGTGSRIAVSRGMTRIVSSLSSGSIGGSSLSLCLVVGGGSGGLLLVSTLLDRMMAFSFFFLKYSIADALMICHFAD